MLPGAAAIYDCYKAQVLDGAAGGGRAGRRAGCGVRSGRGRLRGGAGRPSRRPHAARGVRGVRAALWGPVREADGLGAEVTPAGVGLVGKPRGCNNLYSYVVLCSFNLNISPKMPDGVLECDVLVIF